MINYEKLLIELQARGLSGKDLVAGAGLSSATAAKIAKGEKVSKKTLQKIADYLECKPEALYSTNSHNKILSILREEKEARNKKYKKRGRLSRGARAEGNCPLVFSRKALFLTTRNDISTPNLITLPAADFEQLLFCYIHDTIYLFRY